ncbi:VOC family protein [Rehaibacterium terrae]|jgi:predicted 3-demethylubiquinone-9 3-methyltransferase (glyoxalase superfamily)|uniref:Putative 3-demethylubiquinone-9 3-methyltransferase (Glyoxalase superfamily) n=1 Tax=Rehaibacterium terrae TaxID=1341696 RepID=A0A7W7V6X8_9GAMM|nr:VOC family protein [Rehaibacterium terrae]MBB5014321.1 putative 3-demethylubiquinone-9 3-methyltransferase (glyoxalase superfamily) [Rehaibacterium terrae]
MATRFQRITPFLWFDAQAEEAAEFYVSIFDNSRIRSVARYDQASAQASGRPEGAAMTVDFELDGQRFTALNGGPHFAFTEAVSFVVHCDTQEEIDRYWDRLSEGGDPRAQQCGWLKDRYGLSWQIVPRELPALLGRGDSGKAGKVMQALLSMKKPDLAALRAAAE